jgi:hypothetical protein
VLVSDDSPIVPLTRWLDCDCYCVLKTFFRLVAKRMTRRFLHKRLMHLSITSCIVVWEKEVIIA